MPPLPCGIWFSCLAYQRKVRGGSELLLLKTRGNLGKIRRGLASKSIQNQTELWAIKIQRWNFAICGQSIEGNLKLWSRKCFRLGQYQQTQDLIREGLLALIDTVQFMQKGYRKHEWSPKRFLMQSRTRELWHSYLILKQDRTLSDQDPVSDS